jgi:hypothetical protein
MYYVGQDPGADKPTLREYVSSGGKWQDGTINAMKYEVNVNARRFYAINTGNQGVRVGFSNAKDIDHLTEAFYANNKWGLSHTDA